jgi:hypothetical protein
MKLNATHSAWGNRVFLKIWLASLVSGTAVAAHDTAFALNAAGFLLVFMTIPALPKTDCDLGRTLMSFVRLQFPFVTWGRPKMYETSFFETESSVPLLL